MRFSVLSLLSASFFLSVFPNSAFAQGNVRVEASTGWDHLTWDPQSSPPTPRETLKFSGVSYGGTIGYDFAVAMNTTLGIDAAYSGTTADVDRDSDTRSIHIRRDIYIGGRATFKVLSGLRVYGKAGYANARIVTNPGFAFYQNTPRYAISPDSLRNVGGIRAGAGLQLSVFGPIYALGEYNYTRYSEKLSRNNIVAGLGIRF